MRENRTYGLEGGGAGNATGSPYPYRTGHFELLLSLPIKKQRMANK